jgi:hypothetical protein
MRKTNIVPDQAHDARTIGAESMKLRIDARVSILILTGLEAASYARGADESAGAAHATHLFKSPTAERLPIRGGI